MPKIFIPNKSFHDYSKAQEFGELVYLTDGLIRNRVEVNQLYRLFVTKMSHAEPEDMLLVSGMPLLNVVASSILVEKFGALNLLIFYRGEYVPRRVLPGGMPDTEGS